MTEDNRKVISVLDIVGLQMLPEEETAEVGLLAQENCPGVSKIVSGCTSAFASGDEWV
jgi:hypothetical protein